MNGRHRFLAPNRRDEATTSVLATQFICNASGEYAAAIISVPRTGNLTRFEFNMQAVGNVPDNGIRCSFQGVSVTTGFPDGVDESVTISSGSITTGWINPGDFDSPRAVTAGQHIALVIENVSFTAGDSFTVGHQLISSDSAMPYSILPSGAKDQNLMPVCALRYDDGTYERIASEVFPVSTIANWGNTQSDTTPDEVGTVFMVQRPYTLLGFSSHHANGTTGTTHTVTLFDAGGNVIHTMTYDSGVTASTGDRMHQHYFPTPVMLRPGHSYRWSIKPNSSTVTMLFYYDEFASEALMNTCYAEGWYACARTDGGAWTNYNNGSDGYRRLHVSFLLETVSAPQARGRLG